MLYPSRSYHNILYLIEGKGAYFGKWLDIHNQVTLEHVRTVLTVPRGVGAFKAEKRAE